MNIVVLGILCFFGYSMYSCEKAQFASLSPKEQEAELQRRREEEEKQNNHLCMMYEQQEDLIQSLLQSL